MSEKVEQLLRQVQTINDAYKIVKKNTGEDFNLFQILGMETAEVKTHSKFLAELLNPKGSHLQGDIFLKLFVQYLNEESGEEENTDLLNGNKINLNSEKSQIQIEKHIGKITDNEGGRIDITIFDSENRLICIENKIYAGEQDKQLLRYKNFGDKFTECHLLFLTLNGNKCSTLKEEDGIVYSISYKKHIVEWLELCKKEAVNLPILRETLGQYSNLIKKLTNQTTNFKMGEDVQKIIEKNLQEAKLIKDNYDSTVNNLMLEQVKIMKSVFLNNRFTESELSIKRALRLCDGLFVSLKIFEQEKIELGINIELANDYYYFVLAPLDGSRDCKTNNSQRFSHIKSFLDSKIGNLTLYNNWTIGKSSHYNIGIQKDNFYYPQSNNEEKFKELVQKIIEFKNLLNS